MQSCIVPTTKKKDDCVKMLPEFDAIVENFNDIDEQVYELWLRGLSISEASTELLQSPAVQEWGRILPPTCDLHKIVSMDTSDHYRTFGELEKVLVAPHKLADDCMHQINPKDQQLVIEKYYGLDDAVVREVIGKKMSGRSRKDLDDVEEKTGVLLRSCRRQFDNMKRIYKYIEDASGPLVQTIQSYFLLPLSLSKKYAAIVFLLLNRFETSKRRLNYVTFEDYYTCAFAMMEHWCAAPAPGTAAAVPTSDYAMLDRDFLLQLRDVKCLLEREKEHKSLVVCWVRRAGGASVAEAEATFKLLSRPLIGLAVALHTSKELRDLFVDLVERVVEVVRGVRWNTTQAAAFLAAVATTGARLLDGTPAVRTSWERYMKVMIICVVQLHHT